MLLRCRSISRLLDCASACHSPGMYWQQQLRWIREPASAGVAREYLQALLQTAGMATGDHCSEQPDVCPFAVSTSGSRRLLPIAEPAPCRVVRELRQALLQTAGMATGEHCSELPGVRRSWCIRLRKSAGCCGSKTRSPGCAATCSSSICGGSASQH